MWVSRTVLATKILEMTSVSVWFSAELGGL
jgi:hypothetical protein